MCLMHALFHCLIIVKIFQTKAISISYPFHTLPNFFRQLVFKRPTRCHGSLKCIRWNLCNSIWKDNDRFKQKSGENAVNLLSSNLTFCSHIGAYDWSNEEWAYQNRYDETILAFHTQQEIHTELSQNNIQCPQLHKNMPLSLFSLMCYKMHFVNEHFQQPKQGSFNLKDN